MPGCLDQAGLQRRGLGQHPRLSAGLVLVPHRHRQRTAARPGRHRQSRDVRLGQEQLTVAYRQPVIRHEPDLSRRHRQFSQLTAGHLAGGEFLAPATGVNGVNGTASRVDGPMTRTLRARRLCFANGHDVDSVDVFRLLLHARLDATHQCPDLTTAQAIVDVNPGDNPYSARADEGEYARAVLPPQAEGRAARLRFFRLSRAHCGPGATCRRQVAP